MSEWSLWFKTYLRIQQNLEGRWTKVSIEQLGGLGNSLEKWQKRWLNIAYVEFDMLQGTQEKMLNGQLDTST